MDGFFFIFVDYGFLRVFFIRGGQGGENGMRWDRKFEERRKKKERKRRETVQIKKIFGFGYRFLDSRDGLSISDHGMVSKDQKKNQKTTAVISNQKRPPNTVDMLPFHPPIFLSGSSSRSFNPTYAPALNRSEGWLGLEREIYIQDFF